MQIQDITTALLILTMAISVYAISKWWGEYQTGIGLEPDRDRDGFYMNSSHYDHGVSTTAAAIMVFTVIPQFIILFGIPMYLESILPLWFTCLIEIIILNIIYYFIIKSAWRMSEINEVECLKLNVNCSPYSDYVKHKVKQGIYEKYQNQLPRDNSYVIYYNMTHKNPYQKTDYREESNHSEDYNYNTRSNDDFRRR
ncbi:MAG: hypothetical protein IJJ47_11285 [Methanosphaera sp.]|nr:hypothetical protein [Methanosphaera sp.]